MESKTNGIRDAVGGGMEPLLSMASISLGEELKRSMEQVFLMFLVAFILMLMSGCQQKDGSKNSNSNSGASTSTTQSSEAGGDALSYQNSLSFQYSTGTGSSSSDVVAEALASCSSKLSTSSEFQKSGGSLRSDLQGYQIQAANGDSNALEYQLNMSPRCQGFSSLTWSHVGNSTTGTQKFLVGDSKVGSVLTSFSQKGEYIVTASLSSSVENPVQVAQKTVVLSQQGSDFVLSGPDFGIEGTDLTFSSVISTDLSLQGATVDWDFGDGGVLSSQAPGPVNYAYALSGEYTISATLHLSATGTSLTQTRHVTILMVDDALICISDMSLSLPTEVIAGESVSMSVYIPPCMVPSIVSVNWSFGDGSGGSVGTSIQHSYLNSGALPLQVILNTNRPDTPQLRMDRVITVLPPVAPSPTPTPVSSSTPEPSVEPSPSSSPTPTSSPVLSPIPTLTEPTPTPVSTPVSTPVPTPVSTPLPTPVPTPVSTPLPTLTPTPIPTLIPTPTPTPILITYSWVKTDQWTTCSANCGGFQESVFQCQDNWGRIVSEDHCSQMKRPQSEKQICDGDPKAVYKEEVSVSDEDGSVSTLCPANQIGIILQERKITTKTIYACVSHEVKSQAQIVQYGPWVKTPYCRDFVAYRCSNDSLSNTEAQGRYKWMKKCQDEVPVIKEFLEKFDDVTYSGNISINNKGRDLYPTFMVASVKPKADKFWKAPISPNENCKVPKNVYIATVCVSSCATPEEYILVYDDQPVLPQKSKFGANNKGRFKYQTFIESFLDKTQWVATLQQQSHIDSKSLKKTKVDQWITEFQDSDQVILRFRMKSGGELRVTRNHPLVTTKGTVQSAENFAVGDSLVLFGGAADPIVSIESTQYHGKVYNLFVNSNAPLENIVIVGGYLNGTAFYQNEGASNLNRQLFHEEMLKGVFSL